MQKSGSPLQANSRPGRSVNPATGISEQYQDRKESIILIKILVAIVVTLAIAVGVAALAKKSIRTPSYENR